MDKTSFTCFSTDVIHEGHLNIINEVGKYGRVIVGCLSDSASIRHNQFPTIPETQRMELYKSIEGVDSVVMQQDMMYDDVIEALHPDYVVHGDNWMTGAEMTIRSHVESTLSKYGGKVI